ncbi:hypothetical protein AB0I10_38380 [Streptomyces sp. NPDC050636]|uniref:hypothetical protein n=1 Tax=Streptomyces sp. NPDC050636 TaxID=3154510 RepID=UPI003431CAAA
MLDGGALTEAEVELARAVLAVVLLAGLVPYHAEAVADGEESCVGLVRCRATTARCG